MSECSLIYCRRPCPARRFCRESGDTATGSWYLRSYPGRRAPARGAPRRASSPPRSRCCSPTAPRSPPARSPRPPASPRARSSGSSPTRSRCSRRSSRRRSTPPRSTPPLDAIDPALPLETRLIAAVDILRRRVAEHAPTPDRGRDDEALGSRLPLARPPPVDRSPQARQRVRTRPRPAPARPARGRPHAARPDHRRHPPGAHARRAAVAPPRSSRCFLDGIRRPDREEGRTAC